jgi:hypothetical protein
MKKEQRKVLSIIHKASGVSALLLISTFFLSSVYAELNGELNVILTIKTFIVFTMPLMLVLMPTCAITGKKIAGKSKSPIVKSKNSRVKFIAFNGIVLIILAIILYNKVVDGRIDQTFLILQFVEFAFGFANIIMLGLMIKDGRILTGKIKPNIK